MDEDGVLDLSQMSEIGIGIIDPEGNGIGFTLHDLSAIWYDKENTAPVKIYGGQKFLSVNDYNVIPAGILADTPPIFRNHFAPVVSANYNLKLPSPSIPDHRLLVWKPADFTAPAQLLHFLRADTHPVSRLLATHQSKQLTKMKLDKVSDEKSLKRMQRELARKTFGRVTALEVFKD